MVLSSGKHSDRPQIVVLGPLPPPYHGVSVAIRMMVESELREEFDFVTVNTKRPLSLGGDFSFTKLKRDTIASLQLLWALRRRPRIVYLPLSQTRLGALRDAIWILKASSLGCKCIIHLHGSYFRTLLDRDLEPIERRIIQRALSRVSAAIVLSDSFRSIFHGLVCDDRIFVVHNGVDKEAIPPKRLEEAMIRRRQNGCSRLRVAFLSNLFEAKGFGELLEAAAWLTVHDHGTHFSFHLAGAWESDSVQQKWLAYIDQRGLRNQIEFLGVVDGAEKFRFLLNSDVFVFPSYQYEGQPLCIIEALAAGLPVIATARGCIPEMVWDGINGFIISEKDPVIIANKLRLLARNPELRVRMGYASRCIYEENYTAQVFIKGLKGVFQQVLEMDQET